MGVTIIGILYIIGGAFLLLAGVMILALGAVGTAFAKSLFPAAGTVVAALAIFIAIVVFVVGGLAIAAGIGNLKGYGWAWVLVIVLTILGLVRDVLSLFNGNVRTISGTIVGIAISAFVLWYYFRPNVKAFFGRGGMQSQQQQVVVR